MTLFKISTIYGAWDVDVEQKVVPSEPSKSPSNASESPRHGNGSSGDNIDFDKQFDNESHGN